MRSDVAATPQPHDQSTTYRSLLAICSAPGCTTLTMGGTCVEHDVPGLVVFPRGRPFPAPQLTSLAPRI